MLPWVALFAVASAAHSSDVSSSTPPSASCTSTTSSGATTRIHVYDGHRLRETVTLRNADGSERRLRAEYDAAGRLVGLHLSDVSLPTEVPCFRKEPCHVAASRSERSARLLYDEADRLREVQRPGSSLARVHLDGLGRITRFTDARGTGRVRYVDNWIEWAEDERDRRVGIFDAERLTPRSVSRLTCRGTTCAPIEVNQLEVDAEGRPTRLVRLPVAFIEDQVRMEWTWDKAGHLVEETRSRGAGVSVKTIAYEEGRIRSVSVDGEIVERVRYEGACGPSPNAGGIPSPVLPHELCLSIFPGVARVCAALTGQSVSPPAAWRLRVQDHGQEVLELPLSAP